MKKIEKYPNKKYQKPINAETAQQILKEDGLKVTLEEAQKILELLREFAGITVRQYILKTKK